MPVHKCDIEQFLELAKTYPVLDVRSPAEFKHAHIPGAYNLPLFSDEERKMVGTAYKQQSREIAIKIGLDFFGPKMKQIIDDTEAILKKHCEKLSNKDENHQTVETNHKLQTSNHKLVLVHCWRGGMRSAGVAWLMDLYGFKVYTLVGGYKKFRNYVLDTFKLPFNFKILGGYTGSGKTYLLKALAKKGERVIDLEDLAKHKGSAFGNIGLPPQPSQEMFENILALELLSHSSPDSYRDTTTHPIAIGLPIWLEDESQRIGQLNIPGDLWDRMRDSPVFFLDIPFETRLTHIVEEYGGLDREKLVAATERITKKLGHLDANLAISYLENGETREAFSILLRYYDRFYFKALHNREAVHSLLHTIPCKSITPENANLLDNLPVYQPEKG
jgi:tRNA 2-selenouridine synthase